MSTRSPGNRGALLGINRGCLSWLYATTVQSRTDDDDIKMAPNDAIMILISVCWKRWRGSRTAILLKYSGYRSQNAASCATDTRPSPCVAQAGSVPSVLPDIGAFSARVGVLCLADLRHSAEVSLYLGHTNYFGSLLGVANVGRPRGNGPLKGWLWAPWPASWQQSARKASTPTIDFHVRMEQALWGISLHHGPGSARWDLRGLTHLADPVERQMVEMRGLRPADDLARSFNTGRP